MIFDEANGILRKEFGGDSIRRASSGWLYGKTDDEIASILAETEWAMGNFIGQAIVRSIDCDGVTEGINQSVLSANCIQSVVEYLHFYENLKYSQSQEEHLRYTPTFYPEPIQQLILAQGATMESVLAIDDSTAKERGAPSGCYTNATFTRGMTLLTSPTVIWNGASGSYEDNSSDILIGFSFVFYGCDSMASNTQVRVSTNGYCSFFQQGGGATNGTANNNYAIPQSADPDGYAGPWWDHSSFR